MDVAEHSRVIFGVILSRNCSQMFRFCSREGSSATDSLTDLTDRRKFGNGFFNGFNG
ncbi:hypothetical protein [Microcoleus sp. PH2017_21_RUC_O_A]|uniref:hypothetical protein n=1 Tax=Microcoleus sp. PH2017_21_RUC_O_A TaxID=2798832 RepID=UPI0025E4CA69|nr:hypothetical protein [Microcoleus sp. PH2017_21_RUC_O_A]